MKAFNHNASKPKYLDKHQKAFEVILIAFWCVIFPAISAICCSLNGQKPIFKSLSYIAYREKHMGLVLFYGFLFVAGFILSMKMCLDAGQYSKQLKYLFFGIESDKRNHSHCRHVRTVDRSRRRTRRKIQEIAGNSQQRRNDRLYYVFCDGSFVFYHDAFEKPKTRHDFRGHACLCPDDLCHYAQTGKSERHRRTPLSHIVDCSNSHILFDRIYIDNTIFSHATYAKHPH